MRPATNGTFDFILRCPEETRTESYANRPTIHRHDSDELGKLSNPAATNTHKTSQGRVPTNRIEREGQNRETTVTVALEIYEPLTRWALCHTEVNKSCKETLTQLEQRPWHLRHPESRARCSRGARLGPAASGRASVRDGAAHRTVESRHRAPASDIEWSAHWIG